MSDSSTRIRLPLEPIIYGLLVTSYFVFAFTQINFQANHVIGVIITLSAFTLWIVARLQLGNSFSLTAQAKGLVTKGLYSKLRHPVYYFAILVLVGINIFVWNAYMLIPLTILIAIEAVRIRQEDKVLKRAFGKEYLKYRSTTWF